MARPCAHNAARPHLSPVPVRAQRGTPAPATLMAREQVTTVPRRQARGGHVACAPAAGRVSDPSTEVQTPARDNHRGPGMGHLPFYTHVTGMARPTAHNAARPHLQRCARAERSADPRKLLARPPPATTFEDRFQNQKERKLFASKSSTFQGARKAPNRTSSWTRSSPPKRISALAMSA